MQMTILKAQLHNACVTELTDDNEIACFIDGDLLALAGIREYEQIQIYNLDRNYSINTYAVHAQHGSRTIALSRGLRMTVGDRLIICAYAECTPQECRITKPVLVYCDQFNHVIGTTNSVSMSVAS